MHTKINKNSKVHLDGAISYNLHFEIMQDIPKSVNLAKFDINCAFRYD